MRGVSCGAPVRALPPSWLASLLLCLTAFEAAAFHEAAGSPPRFTSLTSEHGLVQNWVAAILQDKAGYIWIGTHGGLHRYDGHELLTFLHDPLDSATISDNSISALHEDTQGRLWIGTSTGGINLFDRERQRFVRYRNRPGDESTLVHNRVWAITSDRSGRLWVATDAGLDSLDAEAATVTHHPLKRANGGVTVVRALLTDRNGRVWVGTFDGLFVVDPETLEVPAFSLPGDQRESDRPLSVSALYEDAQGRLWIGSDAWVTIIVAARDRVEKVLRLDAAGGAPAGAGVVSGIVQDTRGDIWLATDGEGLFRTHAGRDGSWQLQRFRHDPREPSGIPDNYLSTVFRDSTGVLWFGTSIAGVSRLNPATEGFGHFRRVNDLPFQLPGNVVWSMHEDDNGDVWVATESGLALQDVATGHFETVALEQGAQPSREGATKVYYVTRSATGVLWVGTAAGVFSFDEQAQAFVFHDVFADYQDIEYIEIVHYIMEDSDGVLWLGTFNGLLRYDPEAGSTLLARRSQGNLLDNWVMAVVEGRDGVLWVGTEAGLQKLDRHTGQPLASYQNDPADEHSISHDSVQSLYLGNAGELWVGTAAGLNRLNMQTGRMARYNRHDGLPSDHIYAVTGDASGLVWASTNNGLFRLDPATGTVVSFDTSDGLQASEFNTGSVHRGQSGKLYFGGINGFNAFRPQDVVGSRQPPRVAVTSAQIAGERTHYGKDGSQVQRLELAAEQNALSFTFAAFDFRAPQRHRFSYRLEGVDRGWRSSENASSVLYSNLKPGRYVFRVRAASSDGVWSADPATVDIRILPPLWKSTPALVAYGALLVVLLWLGLRLWRARGERERMLRTEIEKRNIAERMQSITQGLSATLNTGTISEQLLGSAVDLVPHNFSALFLDDGGVLKLFETRGVAEADKARVIALPREAGSVMQGICEAGEPVVVPAQALFSVGDETQEEQPLGMAQLLCAPLSHFGEYVGLLILARRAGKAFTMDERKIAGLLVNHALFAFQNARLFAEIERQAITDELTGLHNRRHFLSLARREFSRSVRYESSLSVIVIDADHFKNINDQHGHQAGDEVLRALAKICNDATRNFDIVGRYGGEEFIILLPETNVEVATSVARRIREIVSQSSSLSVNNAVRLTISAGVAERTENTPDLLSLINAADQALYAAKRAGRNRVVKAPTPAPQSQLDSA